MFKDAEFTKKLITIPCLTLSLIIDLQAHSSDSEYDF